MKVAIIGAGVAGLSCALEFEHLGVHADLFERDCSIGWLWPSVNYWPSIFYRDMEDIVQYIKTNYNLDLKPLAECKHIVLSSPNKKASIRGKLGHFFVKGKNADSIEMQIARELRFTPIHYNHNADYKELSKKYDWVIVATGSDAIARDLGIWEEKGLVRSIGGVVVGHFDPHASYLYLNTEYAGTGYARLTPFSSTEAIVGLYTIGLDEFQSERLFSEFMIKEGLSKLEFIYKILPQPFSTGKLKKYQVDNILFVGRAAGLTERLLGVGGPAAIVSGMLAARSIVNGQSYKKLLKPLLFYTENISSFRNIINKFANDDFDRLIALLGTPGLKQLIYNTDIDFTNNFGRIIKHIPLKPRPR